MIVGFSGCGAGWLLTFYAPIHLWYITIPYLIVTFVHYRNLLNKKGAKPQGRAEKKPNYFDRIFSVAKIHWPLWFPLGWILFWLSQCILSRDIEPLYGLLYLTSFAFVMGVIIKKFGRKPDDK